METKYLALPGPTYVEPDVLLEMSKPIFNHRNSKFKELLIDVTEKTKKLLMTENEVFFLTSSGTGAMECAVVNCFSRGDKVLALINGSFGQRFADIAKQYEVEVIEHHGTWGKGFDQEKIKEIINEHGDSLKGITIVHCETSTGVLNDIKSISELRVSEDTLLLVDGISSIGAESVETDQWGIDVILTGSQKVLALPPGLAIIAFSHKALLACENSKLPKYYWDIKTYRKFYKEKKETPYTPAIPLYTGLLKQLKELESKGFEKEIEKHKNISNMVRTAIRAMGLELLNDDHVSANTVTPILVPEGIDLKEMRTILLKKYGVDVAGGQGKLEGQIFRIGHLGNVEPLFVISVLAALEMTLKELGHPLEIGTGVKAAQEFWFDGK
ncbi:alanine--glyoxylate aminotransferase family protein [Alkalicella caledoniensis]|uniref:Tritium exchange subunit n=1 Tax=Alkalicella caledoniensis TaxID=2731377 RepID=A0A7G9W8H4_ALKCA|nr:alanine--glyoxylate aminotransferase family protein [Alkalicella caledoniensis]QNO14986.1 alanine--glyoxylate aminotransferase family protein [Alkalicella caledoniensis]